MRLSVIIPVKADPRLARCLDALDRQTLPADQFEVIVVDNGGPDAKAAIATAVGARYLTHPDGGSYAARAAGASLATGDVLVFTDADCEPPPGWLAAIAALFAEPDCLVATGPSSARSGSAGSGSAARSVVSRWVQTIDEARWRRLLPIERVAFCDTRSLAIRRETLAAVPFDPSFRQAGDIDLGIRLFAAGIPIRLAESLRLAHDHPTSLIAVHRRAMRRGRGLEKLDRKHGARTGPTGQRPLRIAGRDVKGIVLRWSRRPGLRWGAIVLVAAAVTILMPLLAIVARLPSGGSRGQGAFVLFERLSLLLGRLLGQAPSSPLSPSGT